MKIDKKKHWEVFDHFVYKDGSKELVNKVSYNVVTVGLSKLIACYLKNYTGTGAPSVSQPLYLAVGTGTSAAAESDVKLTSELTRKQITDIKFIDSAGTESSTITNRLEIVVTFANAEAVGTLTEFGIFAGTATATADSGFMINHKVHTAITKTSEMQLERTIRLTF